MTEERWYVYAVHVNGLLAYIGKGTNQRYLVSARRLGGIAGILKYFKSERLAIECECRLIARFKPEFNKTKGGEGFTRLRLWSKAAKDAAIERRWTQEAYDRADKTGYWLDILGAAAFARCELDSRGIKWRVEEPAPALADPKGAEAIRRMLCWLKLSQAALHPSLTCSA
ncbi:MAG TPA: hypothetical protein VMS08_06315 [Candidatus Saccharimonadia bacterium]|nr:hypothetical protein [Candidatus Saccharimonadia bacterium]